MRRRHCLLPRQIFFPVVGVGLLDHFPAYFIRFRHSMIPRLPCLCRYLYERERGRERSTSEPAPYLRKHIWRKPANPLSCFRPEQISSSWHNQLFENHSPKIFAFIDMTLGLLSSTSRPSRTYINSSGSLSSRAFSKIRVPTLAYDIAN